MSDDLPGLDLARLRRHLDQHSPGLLGADPTGRLITGGRSNLTYDITDGTTHLVVRRPPLGHVLATAHDMGREHRVVTALADTAVPVPKTYLLCTDADVIGAPFYVMERLTGTAYRRAADLAQLGPQRTRDVSVRLVDTLVDLHDVDPGSVGLSDFGRPDGYLTRQVARWHQQLEGSRSRPIAGIDELHAYLESHVPVDSGGTIVHGDFRLDNVLVDDSRPGDPITGVVDWEMATLGDPLADIALTLAYQALASKGSAGLVADAPRAAGHLSRTEALDRYAERSGRDLSEMGFYLALAYFKLAIILEGIHYRYIHGQTVGEGFESIGTMVEPLVADGLAAVRRSPSPHDL